MTSKVVPKEYPRGSHGLAQQGMLNLADDLLAEGIVEDMKKIHEGKWIKYVGSYIEDQKWSMETIKDTSTRLKCRDSG